MPAYPPEAVGTGRTSLCKKKLRCWSLFWSRPGKARCWWSVRSNRTLRRLWGAASRCRRSMLYCIATTGANSLPTSVPPKVTPRRRRSEKKLPKKLQEIGQDWGGTPIRLMFQSEARFDRLNDVRRCWAPTPHRPVCIAMLTHECWVNRKSCQTMPVHFEHESHY